MSAFDRLHPAIQHHIVNTLVWSSLRPLQEASIDPLLAGEHAMLLAPTAGGKTEAAFFPILSRVLSEDWPALSVLYVCPLRALLNNLEIRLEQYCSLVGRRVALWHGDVGAGARRRILSAPPDCLLTTPESLEVMLISRRSDKARLFANLQVVIVDEVHAFAGDDRGWHLLSVLERISRLAGREIQRVGLSATVGNPEALLGWLAGSCGGPRRVVAPDTMSAASANVTLDYVGTLENAATVISRLHSGEKRLAFCDSRARVEELASGLRRHGIETFVSHSSIGREERHRAEAAFAAGSNCVIVATSTLELGIDVGDLDRVIQIDAPHTVSSVLQRLGRTGRRPGAERNFLFLATSEDTVIRAAALMQLMSEGYVEPVSPPADPCHILAQQIMALALQENGIGKTTWRRWIEKMPGFAAMPEQTASAILAHMIRSEILWDDSGILWLGRQGESSFGRQNFMELFSVFTSEPLIAVRYGRVHLGQVDQATFAMRHEEVPVLLLAGRSWVVTHIDWQDRIAYVEPSEAEGKSRWLGSGQPLHFALCQAIRRVLTDKGRPGKLSRRAEEKLSEVREGFGWLESDGTTVLRDETGITWWTFGGLLANAPIAAKLRSMGIDAGKADNLFIPITGEYDPKKIEDTIKELAQTDPEQMATPIEAKALDDLKFSACLPADVATAMLQRRLTDHAAIRSVLAERVRLVSALEA